MMLSLFLREDDFLAECAVIVDNSELEVADTIKIWTRLYQCSLRWLKC